MASKSSDRKTPVSDELVTDLRVRLLNAQFDLRTSQSGVVILIGGEDRHICEAAVDRLHEWLDARYLRTRFFGEPQPDERVRPRFWRYWRAIPPRGRMAIFFGAWSMNAIVDRLSNRIDRREFDARLARIRAMEEMLVADGLRLVKLWLRCNGDEAVRSPRVAGLGGGRLWPDLRRFEKVEGVVNEMLSVTSAGPSPWVVIEEKGRDEREQAMGEAIVDRLTDRTLPRPQPVSGEIDESDRFSLGKVDLTRSLDREAYVRKLERQQERITRLSRKAHERRMSTIVVLEGWDAAGKGGAIRRLARAVLLRDISIHPIGAPEHEARRYHYLWRFWKRIPRDGRLAVFDRSWYGRVLVERVERLASEEEWGRAYEEIRDFESQLVAHGATVCKIFLHIDPDEQLRRFRAREQTPYKKYKLTEEDFRNRERWGDYVAAIEDMVTRTSTEACPWHVVPANDKRHARVRVLKLIARAMERGLKR